MRFLVFILIIFYSASAFASEPNDENAPILNFGLAQFNIVISYTNEGATNHLVDEKLNKHFESLAKRQAKYKKEVQFVEYVFYYIHRKLLKKYVQYSSVNETITSGIYDCVTATALYSLFLTELDIPFSVIETNYHVYVIVFPDSSQEVLLETTDPLAGFITNKQEITNRKKRYAIGNAEQAENQAKFDWSIENKLQKNELIGVLLYNQSVKQHNLGNNIEAKKLAQEALLYYDSNRIKSYLGFLGESRLASN